MQLDRDEIARRTQAATPKDTVRGMIFNGALGAVRQIAGEPAAVQCLAAVGNPKWIDFFSYPVTDYLKLASAAVERMAPHLESIEAGFFQLGHQATSSFLASGVGKTLVTMVSGDPRRLLSNVPTAYRTAVSYGARSVSWIGERHCKLSFKHDFLFAPFHEGVLGIAVEAMGGKSVKVVGKDTGFLESEYDITWE